MSDQYDDEANDEDVDEDDERDWSETVQEAATEQLAIVGEAALVFQRAYLHATLEVLRGLTKLTERELALLQPKKTRKKQVERPTVTGTPRARSSA